MSEGRKSTGRRPADQPGAGRQDMWLALKNTPDKITVSDLVARTKLHRATVLRYLQALTAGGYLRHDPAPAGLSASWALVRDVGYHAPRIRADGSAVTQGEVTEQLWTAMCGLETFDYRDLMQAASIEIPEATAKDYCKRLLSTGYLRVLTTANPAAGRIARYRLIRPSGPQAPQVQRVQQVFDPNTGAVYPVEARS